MPTRETEPQVPIGFRLPEQLVARIDAYAEKVRQSFAGHRINRSDAIRALLEKALTAEGFPGADAKPSKRR